MRVARMSLERWRWVAWPNVRRPGPKLVFGFDFINESKRPLTWFSATT